MMNAMRLIVVFFLMLCSATAWAQPRTRAQFTAQLAKARPGMTADQITQLLGPPDDVRTERDPGGIRAARTVEVWRYGTSRHLGFGTLGTVHLEAGRRVQYVFGGKGKPFTGIAEPELRRLLELIDAVPSYNATLEPLALIRAVNALQPLGKARALDVIDEYLRVSSDLDDPGREGVFLVLRVLFDPAVQVPMYVGGPTLAAPTDPTLLPRFPLILVDDVPYKLVDGYQLGGSPQTPESDVATFRKTGTLRPRPLAPTAKALDALEAYLAGPLAAAIKVHDALRVSLYDQALRFFDTVYRPPNQSANGWFADLTNLTSRWKALRATINQLGARWDSQTQQLVLPNGTALPPPPALPPSVLWDLPVPSAKRARVTLQRLSDQLVSVDLRFELAAGVKLPADELRVVDAKTGALLEKIAFGPYPATAGMFGSVIGRRLALARGTAISLVLGSGAKGPTVTP